MRTARLALALFAPAHPGKGAREHGPRDGPHGFEGDALGVGDRGGLQVPPLKRGAARVPVHLHPDPRQEPPAHGEEGIERGDRRDKQDAVLHRGDPSARRGADAPGART